jgi:hypothetical protein
MSRSYTSSPPKRLHGVQRDCFAFISLIQAKIYGVYYKISRNSQRVPSLQLIFMHMRSRLCQCEKNCL